MRYDLALRPLSNLVPHTTSVGTFGAVFLNLDENGTMRCTIDTPLTRYLLLVHIFMLNVLIFCSLLSPNMIGLALLPWKLFF